MTEIKTRNPGIDALRGLAIVLVDMGPSPGGVTRYSGERRQAKFTRVYTCGEVVKMLSLHSPAEVLVNVKKEKFSERTGDCV